MSAINPEPETAEVSTEVPTEAPAEEIAKQLVDSFNSHGLTADDVKVPNDVCVVVDMNGKTHRGQVTEMTPGIIRTARRAGWHVDGIGFRDNTLVLRPTSWVFRD